MARSIWKGPFVDGYLLKKAEASRSSGRHEFGEFAPTRMFYGHSSDRKAKRAAGPAVPGAPAAPGAAAPGAAAPTAAGGGSQG
jgi:hypothetical protein